MARFSAGLQRGAALQAAATRRPRTASLGPVYRNTVKGNPRYGMFFRTVDVQGQRVHVYSNGQRIAVGPSRTPAKTPAVPASSVQTGMRAPRSPRPRRTGYMRSASGGY